ncbi:butyrophilin subfamily 1 member A1-like isoform X3 [Garra rufa]|uniref:butyrophilin subfamily 1 member A1-like isoform X3 n=1 Tax=Garra rufa TaxID=137080 RepID=UPI003CCEA766
MKLICLTFLIISEITVSRSELYEVVGAVDPVFAVAGEDVILPCSVKPNISVVDMRVEWFRLDLKDSQLVHLYEDHEDKNSNQIQSYKGRTKLIQQELEKGNTSLRVSSVQVSDEGLYKCFIQSKSWYDDATVDVRVEAVGSPPVITVDGFDHSGGLHLQCESEGWNPEPDLEWLDSEGVSLSSETTETHRNTDGFTVKHTMTVYERDSKIHCRFKLKHHMLEALIITTSKKMFIFWRNYWRTSVIMISIAAVCSVSAGILLATFLTKTRVTTQLRKYTVNVILDADTAHPHLFVSRDGKQVRSGNRQTKGVDGNKDRFNDYLGVLGKNGFSSGCFYFEVQVKGQTEWYLGVTRGSVNRKGLICLNPMNGYWTVCLRDGGYWAYESAHVSLSPSVDPQRVGVFVDYEKGLVSFYDVDSMCHIYTYTDQLFDEKLFPFICLGESYYSWNTDPTPLIICDDY